MFVARIGRFEGIATRFNLQDDIDIVLELHIVNARSHVNAIAGVITDAVFWNTF